MAHEQDLDVGALVYAGNYDDALKIAKLRYLGNPKGKVVMYASTLYSARRTVDVKDQIKPLIGALTGGISTAFDNRDADALDVISTILAWWSKLTKAPYGGPANAAIEACQLGLELTENAPSSAHTRSFLRLTYATLLLRTGFVQEACGYVRLVAGEAGAILDVSQRTRVYRKLAYLSAKLWNPFAALYWYLKART